METLRTRDHSLLGTTRDSENSQRFTVTQTASLDNSLPAPVVALPNPPNAGESLTTECASSPELATERFPVQFQDPLFPCKEHPQTFAKRVLDIVVALLVLILASPIMIATAIMVKLTSNGPIIFKQVRVGKGGRYFWCYKFRSMCIDAEDRKQQLMHLNEASGPVFKIKRDPRITPIGGFIRKLSIDELPQLFNVLKGEMSLVGPRPPVPSEVIHYTEYQRGRLAVQPGLTCLWQVGGRSNVSFERWVELDLLYIETMSIRNDVKILLQTVPAVLKSSGAH